MAVHRPFQERRWAWVKALLGIGMFESTFAITQSKAAYATSLAKKIVAGEADSGQLQAALGAEWTTLWAIMAISLANVALGVWRPKLQASKKKWPLSGGTEGPTVRFKALGAWVGGGPYQCFVHPKLLGGNSFRTCTIETGDPSRQFPR